MLGAVPVVVADIGEEALAGMAMIPVVILEVVGALVFSIKHWHPMPSSTKGPSALQVFLLTLCTQAATQLAGQGAHQDCPAC